MAGTWSRRIVLQVPAAPLFPLDGLEQRLEVARAKAPGALPLDDLEEDRRSVGDVLGEDLQQVAVVIAVDEDAQLLQVVPRQLQIAEPGPYVRVVVVGDGEEAD